MFPVGWNHNVYSKHSTFPLVLYIEPSQCQS